MKNKQTLQKNPSIMSKEKRILRELGLTDYEIDYLMYLKGKRSSKEKWH